MWQLVFAYVAIERGVLNMNEHCFLYGPGLAVDFLVHNVKQTGVIYQHQCPHIQCSSSYIGESGRFLGERVKEHLKAPSPIHLHSATTGHPMDPNQFNIMHKEVHSQSRTIKEAMFIRVQDPPLNCNIGKYQLPHIWDQLLQSSPVFQPKPT